MSNTPSTAEHLIKDFLEDGTKNLCGDLSIMVSHITNSFALGVAEGRRLERERIRKAENEMAYKVYGLLSTWRIHSNPELADKAMKKLSDYLEPYVNEQYKALTEKETQS